MRPAEEADGPVRDAAALAERGQRVLLGVTGPPGAGKSTLAGRLVRGVDALLGAGTAAYVPMDGFHLANAQLERLGLRHRKGAPHTFDVHGYLELLRRLAACPPHPVYAPGFDRAQDEPVAARLVVAPEVRLVVTEGNYLAHDEEPWGTVRRYLDEVWYLEVPDEVCERRLVRRWLDAGLGEERARERVAGNDLLNADVVRRTRERCTRIVTPEEPG